MIEKFGRHQAAFFTFFSFSFSFKKVCLTRS